MLIVMFNREHLKASNNEKRFNQLLEVFLDMGRGLFGKLNSHRFVVLGICKQRNNEEAISSPAVGEASGPLQYRFSASFTNTEFDCSLFLDQRHAISAELQNGLRSCTSQQVRLDELSLPRAYGDDNPDIRLEQHVKCFGPDLVVDSEQSHVVARVRRDEG